MKVTYIAHSGFIVETDFCYYIFDYYKGEIPVLNKRKEVIVFCSHAHPDHYNPQIFSLLREQGIEQMTAVLANDISRRKYPSGDVECIRVRHDETYELPCDTNLRTLLSTDAGVAFLLTCPEGTIYHAGDLNDWVWEGEPEQDNRQMTGSYRHEIQKLKDIFIDVAFVPLDPRQGSYYAAGLQYFLETVEVGAVYPMHYWNKPEIINQFLTEYPQYRNQIVTNQEK